MRANNYNTGIASEYLVLSLLYRQGMEAYMSIGNKKAIDIRIIKNNDDIISLDVKAVRGYTSIIVNNIEVSPKHFLALVIYNDKFEDVNATPEVYILPSLEAEKIIKHYKKEKRIMKGDILNYKNRWELLV